MANPAKAIHYPTREEEIQIYWNKVFGHLNGPIGAKYNTDPNTLNTLSNHQTQIPLVIQKAYDDDQTAQGSIAAKNVELTLAEKDMLRELKRVTELSNWDEEDGQTMGIRVAKAPFDPTTVKGKITGVTSTHEAVIIDFLKGRLQGVIIESLADGSPVPPPSSEAAAPGNEPVWKKLGTDTKSPFEDTRMNRTNHPEDRYYRIRPMMNDKPVGIYSDIVKVVAEVYPQPAP